MTESRMALECSDRVKAFRTRLSESQFKRVEAYVTTEEKAQIDSIKAKLGTTSDVAVAGLIRLGLVTFNNNLSGTKTHGTPGKQDFLDGLSPGHGANLGSPVFSCGIASSNVVAASSLASVNGGGPTYQPADCQNFSKAQAIASSSDAAVAIDTFFKARKDFKNEQQ